MNAIDALAEENARLQAENERLEAELAQARQWAKAWKQTAHEYRRFAALWRERANRFESLMANVPAYTEETG